MPKTATCVCGQQVQIPDEILTYPTHCPVCGRIIDLTGAKDAAIPLVEPPVAAGPVEANVALDASANPPMLLRMLLDPTTIRRLLFFGGGLSVIGLIAWLVSLGVFDDPQILAVAMGVGTLTLLSSGWGVVLRTRYRLAGQALTFLACVVAPLNLWFYDAQGLLTVDGHLWVGGLICSLLYLITVWRLRDPLFLYAVEAGITMTVLLLLGDLQRATNSSAICLAMLVLAVISIHAEAAFDPNHAFFSRRKFGLPLFFSGQAQLAAGTISLLVMQILNWTLKPVPGEWCHSQIAATPWLAGSIWLAAAYLWFYSDLAVRRLGVYTALAAVALILAEVTLLYPFLPLEVLIVALSVTAILVRVLGNRTCQTGSRWASVANIAASIVSVVAFLLGAAQHFDHVRFDRLRGADGGLLLAAALVGVACNLCFQGFQTTFPAKRSSQVRSGCWSLAGLSLWLGVMHGLDAIGIDRFVQQTPLLTLMPLALMLLAPRLLKRAKRDLVDSAVFAAHAVTIFGLIASASSVKSDFEWFEFFFSGSRDLSSLFASIVFVELTAICFLTQRSPASRRGFVVCGSLTSLAAVWKFLVFVDLPEAWYSPLLGVIGVGLTIIGRMRAVANPVALDSSPKNDQQELRSPWNAAGDWILAIGELVAFFQTLPWLFGQLGSIPIWNVVAVLITAALSALGAAIASSESIRGWHRFAAAVIVSTLTLAWIRSQQLADYQKLELLIEVVGLAWLGIGFSGRLQETDQRREGWVSLALWAGSLTATIPVLFCTLMHRWSSTGPSLGDEIGLITITALMVAIGCVLQVRSTTTFGGLTLGIYLAVLFGHLAYHPQIAIGVYIAAGGALIFLTGVMLSIYRDRLLALPSKIANREGIFRVIDWR